MRVGMVICGRPNFVSGGFLYDRMLADYLRKQGDEVELITVPWYKYGRSLLVNFSSSVLQSLGREQFDVLLQDELIHPSFFRLNRRLKKRFSVSIISIVHHLRSYESRPAWQNRFYRRVEKLYLASVDGFIYNGRTTRRAVEDLAGLGKPSVTAPPAGDRFQAYMTPERIVYRACAPGPLRIIFLGNLIPRKGLHHLLSALAALPRDGWRLTVIGSRTIDPGYTEAVMRRIKQNGLDANVEVLGSLPDAQTADLLALGHVMAVPSTYEGYGIVYLEGMSFGLPGIATTEGGAGEIITHGQDGFMAAPGDSNALAQYICRLMKDREKLMAMSFAALERFAMQPTWDQSGALIHRFLHGLKT